MTTSVFSSNDSKWMQLAMSLARQAAAAGEVPVGAVIVNQGAVIGQGHNRTLTWNDPTAHAEVVALREAAQCIGNHRLSDAELFVTLEPCVMCSGAVLHSRLKRVVYGAPDPKTGTAGSVLDVFASSLLNHQTRVQGGLMAAEGGALLQAFFRQRRANPCPLREDAVRTAESRFAQLAPTPWAVRSRYVQDLPSLKGLQLHYLDECEQAPEKAPVTWLALHSAEDWSHRFHAVIPALLQQGHRVLAPDLIGFGRSDKPKKESFHTRAWHAQVLMEWLEHLYATRLVLLMPDDGHGLGHSLQLAAPHRFLPADLAPLPPWLPPDTQAALNAPYPDAGHRAGQRAFARWS